MNVLVWSEGRWQENRVNAPVVLAVQHLLRAPMKRKTQPEAAAAAASVARLRPAC